MTWSIERLICDATNYARAVVAPVFAPLFVGCEGADEVEEWARTDAYRGADELAEREAEEEVQEPTAPCDCCGHPTSIALLKSGDDGESWCCPDCVKEALASEAEWDAVNGNDDEDHERIGEVSDFIGNVGCTCPIGGPFVDICPVHFREAEPPLTADELVAVRGLIQERYDTNFAGAAASLADIHRADGPSVREDKRWDLDSGPGLRHLSPIDPQQTSAHPPAPTSPAGGPPQLAPAGHPNDMQLNSDSPYGWTSLGHPNERYDYLGPYHTPDEIHGAGPDLATWLEPAVMTVLSNHLFRVDGNSPCEYTYSCRLPMEEECAVFESRGYPGAVDEFNAHLAPLIAKHIAKALPDYPQQ